jgi:hypothetical protein
MMDWLVDDDSAAFWIGGLAVAVGATVLLAFPERGKAFEHAEYLALGAAVPALACALVFGRMSPAASKRIRAGAAALFLAFAVFYLLRVLGKLEWEALAGAGIVAVWLRRARAHAWKGLVPAFLAAALGFVCAFRLIWWHGGWSALRAREPLVPVLLAAFTVLGLAAFLRAKESAARMKPGIWDAAALVLFALGSTRITVDPHDGAFFAGTIALLRQGAWLLWDAPSQYGFLNMALTSLIPARSPWQAVYWANCPLLFVSAAAVYAALRLTTRGRSGVLFSALLAWAAVLVVPGRVWILDGPNASPSVGAFRFLWCYALLGWAAALFLRRKAGRRVELRELAPGAVFWTLGCLWSFESAVYSSAAAWPVFALASAELTRERRRREAALAVLAPAAALAASVAATFAFYRIRLGHGPDWRGFVEFPLAFTSGGTYALAMSPAGPVAVLVWAGVLIVALAAVSLRKSPAAKWLVVPAFAVFWATASYFVSRSHPNNALNLIPLWLSALLASFFAADEERPAVRVLRAGALPLMTGVLLAAFSDPATLRGHVASLLAPRDPAAIDRRLPAADGEVAALLDRAGVRAEDGVAFFWPYLLERLEGPGKTPTLARFWLPLAPAPELSTLGRERQNLYARRFLDREGPDAGQGWILAPKEFDLPELKSRPVVYYGDNPLINPRASGLDDELLVDHRVDGSFESENWRLTHYRRN